MPAEIASLLREATARVERFMDHRWQNPIHGFVPCDYAGSFQVLDHVRSAHLATGGNFCEWGSGFGVATLLASRLGFQAVGIEVEPELVRQSQQLADAWNSSARFAQGSFIPEGGDWLADSIDDLAWLDTTHEPAYELLGLEIEDFDVVFAYPWPGEDRFVSDLFQRYASRGALLVTYHGTESFRLRRKTR